MQINAVALYLTGCNSMSCGEFFDLFFGWNVCKRAPIGYNGLDYVEASLREGWQNMDFKCMSPGFKESGAYYMRS